MSCYFRGEEKSVLILADMLGPQMKNKRLMNSPENLLIDIFFVIFKTFKSKIMASFTELYT